MVIPNDGAPDPDVAFALNDLCLDAAHAYDRTQCGLVCPPPCRGPDRFDGIGGAPVS